jgi:hypothetical protein
VQIVHSLLLRAELPLPTIALAVCVLDSLNSRFALSWRRSCPLPCPLTPFDGLPSQPLHIDSVRPEVIVLAALIIAVKFLDDHEEATLHYAEDWGSGRWTCEQINATQQCIMQNLGYRILPLWKEELISDALEDMETAGRYASGFKGSSTLQGKQLNSPPVTPGKVDTLAGQELTPAITPMQENTPAIAKVTPKIMQSFGCKPQDMPLGRGTDVEIFPLFTQPILHC